MKTLKIQAKDIKAGDHVYIGQYLGCVEILKIVSTTDKQINFVVKQSDRVKNSEPFLNWIVIGKRLTTSVKILAD